MDTKTRVQIQDETVCISYSASTLRKGMNPTILTPATVEIVGQSVLFNLGITTDLEERKL